MARVSRLGMRSVTYAIEGREILSKYGISATVVRLRPGESPEGCAFGLELARADAERAEVLLKKADIEYTSLTRHK